MLSVLKGCYSWCWWLMLLILATWEAEMGRIMVGGLPGQIVRETLLPKNQSKMGWRRG
jgi:hypothetical protein